MKKKKVDKYIFVISGLLVILLVLTILIIKKNKGIRVIKDKYDYVTTLKSDTEYLNQEYEKLVIVRNDNDELMKSNIGLESELGKLEKDIVGLQEKISKMENIK